MKSRQNQQALRVALALMSRFLAYPYNDFTGIKY
jgi:hypothetical protein